MKIARHFTVQAPHDGAVYGAEVLGTKVRIFMVGASKDYPARWEGNTITPPCRAIPPEAFVKLCVAVRKAMVTP